MSKFTDSKRFKSIFVDLSVLSIIGILTSIPYFIYTDFKLIYYYNFEMAFLNSLFFCKDIFGGQSIGKRIFKLRVINSKINTDGDKVNVLALSSFRLILRNLFVYMWPIEIILLVYQDKRLGDVIIQTKVVSFENKGTGIVVNDIIKNLLIFILVFTINLLIIFSALFLLS